MKKFILGIFLCLFTTTSYASRVDNFCGDKYCGYVEQEQVRNHYRKPLKIVTHKEKRRKAIQVASISNKAIGEAPAVYLVAKAEQYLGQTARQIGVRTTLWCSAFIRKLTNAPGVDDRAISWLSKPHIAPSIGAIAVMRHHVGIVKDFNRNGDPIIISGNHGRKVGEGVYSKHRILAYVSL